MESIINKYYFYLMKWIILSHWLITNQLISSLMSKIKDMFCWHLKNAMNLKDKSATLSIIKDSLIMSSSLHHLSTLTPSFNTSLKSKTQVLFTSTSKEPKLTLIILVLNSTTVYSLLMQDFPSKKWKPMTLWNQEIMVL